MTALSTGVVLAPPDFIVSATQVSTFELCPRKWAFRYIDGVESEPNKYAVLGVDTHGHLEQWLRAAVVPVGSDKSVELAQALIPLLPPPQIIDPLNVELSQYYSLCGVTFNLAVDLFMPRWGERPRVFDHKTCGDFKWALTHEMLPKDVQGSLYGCWALHKTQSPDVDLQWNYVRTKGAVKTLPVVATVTGRMVQERVGKSLESARRMRVIAESGATAMQIEYDARGCAAFGGCPHQERCNLSAQEKMTSIVAQATAERKQQGDTIMGDTEAFLASLAATKANGQPQQAQATPAQQQPMQMAPLVPQAAVQQQPMQMAPLVPQVTVQQQPMQMAPLVPQVTVQQQPMQMAPLVPQAPVQQQPMQMAPLVPQAPVQQQAPVMAPAQPFVPPQPPLPPGLAAPEPKKERAPRVKENPWVTFASAALPAFIQMNQPPDAAAAYAAQYADALVKEHDKRK